MFVVFGSVELGAATVAVLGCVSDRMCELSCNPVWDRCLGGYVGLLDARLDGCAGA